MAAGPSRFLNRMNALLSTRKLALNQLLFAAALSLAIFAWVSSARADHNPLPITGLEVIKGDRIDIEPIDAEKPQVVVFLSQKCPCSNSHVEELKKLVTDFPEAQFVGVHSNIDEEPSKVKEYFAKIALPFPIVQDENNQIADRFKASKTPHAYVISKNEIVYRGGVSDSKNYKPENRLYLREALEDLKNHRPLRTPEARTLGCAIPRS